MYVLFATLSTRYTAQAVAAAALAVESQSSACLHPLGGKTPCRAMMNVRTRYGDMLLCG